MYKLSPTTFRISHYTQNTNGIVSKTGLSGTKAHMSAPKTNIINAVKMNMNLPNIPTYSNKANLKTNYNPPRSQVITKKGDTNIFSNKDIYNQKSNLNPSKQSLIFFDNRHHLVQIPKTNTYSTTFKMNVNAQQGYNLIQEYSKNPDFIILDVRTDSQYQSQRLLNSVHYPLSDLQNKLQKLDKNKIYLVYCRSGARSSTAAGIMRRNGFNNVINLVGGIGSWNNHNYPTTQGQQNTKDLQSNISNKTKVEIPKIILKANIGAQQAYQLIKDNVKNKNFVILDVRSSGEHSSQKIQNSINISVSDIESDLRNLDKSKTYLVYCRSGARSSSAAGILKQNGFQNITNMSGGISSWISYGFPIV